MKLKHKKSAKLTLSDRIADALTLKPRADVEDDQVFGTKPKTVSRDDFGSSDSEDEAAISDFRKRNVNLLSQVSKKYEGQVVSREDLEQSESEASEESSVQEHDTLSKIKQKIGEVSSDSDNDIRPSKSKAASDSEDFESDGDGESDDYSITKFQKKTQSTEESDEDDGSDGDDDNEGYDVSQMEEPMKEDFKHVKKQNVSEEAKKGICVRNQLLVWEGLLEMRIHLQRCMNTANQMPMADTYDELKEDNEFTKESDATKANVTNVLDK